MKFNIEHTYETCIYSLKRKNAPWRVKEGCDNRFCLFTGKHYELPNHTICMSCPHYVRDKGASGSGVTPKQTKGVI